ncbi:hypothetical protein BASA61_003355 [Batrachochytrium salamandrivorans]|nr:hypothetical protein BASA61_003355 [Batrachochytrium salamandrivorans]
MIGSILSQQYSNHTTLTSPTVNPELQHRVGVIWRKGKLPKPRIRELDTVKQQKEDNPMIQHKLNSDLVHNDLLIKMFNIQKEILDLMTQVENESSEYRTTMELANLLAKTKLAEGFNSDNSNHQKVTKLVDRNRCMSH